MDAEIDMMLRKEEIRKEKLSRNGKSRGYSDNGLG